MAAAREETTKLTVPRLFIAGTGRGVGTSTVLQGLIVALKRKKVSSALAKIGPSLVDTTHHRRISGRLAHNLDFWLLSRSQLRASLGRLSVGAELVLVEGQHGLFDAHPADSCFQDEASFAAECGFPVVLVVDARGLNESIAAIVNGFRGMNPQLRLAAVVANWVEGEAHSKRLQHAVETSSGVRYLGGIPRSDALIASTSVPSVFEENKSLLTRNRIIAVGDLISSALNLDVLEQCARDATPFEVPSAVLEGLPRQCRVAVADDAAFHLTVQDNLDLIRRAGAEIVAFSPLADVRLPVQTRGLYLPGGYVNLYAVDLQANELIRTAIRNFAIAGGVIYAEGDAATYLFDQVISSSGEKFSMVGLIPGSATYLQAQKEPEYVEVTGKEESVMTRIGDKIRGIRDKAWDLRLEGDTPMCYQLRTRENAKTTTTPVTTPTGLAPLPQVIACPIQFHWASNPQIAKTFCQSASSAPPVAGPKSSGAARGAGETTF